MSTTVDTATATERAAPPAPDGGTSSTWRQSATPYLFLLPGFALFLVVVVYPVGRAFQMSLFEWSVVPGEASPFVGAGNYIRAINDPVFWRSTINTLVYLLVTVPAQMALGMALAVLLNAKIKGRVTFRALYYLPVITSWVVVSLVFTYLFSPDAGAINYLLVDVFRIVDEPIIWLGNRWTALAAICILGIWKGMGWSMLVFLAALQGVPKDLMEAADIDGASKSRRFFSVTLPLLRPVVMFVTIMLIIGGFNVFISVFLMTGGGPAQQTEVLLTYMYNQAFGFLEFGYAAAIAYCVTVFILGLSAAQHKLFRGGEVA